ncbi:MAG: hypothetical protein WBG92_04865, partial [Thiohalocapsa sp.]
MPRRPRFHIDGVPLHTVQRGHNRAACFFDDQDWHEDVSRREAHRALFAAALDEAPLRDLRIALNQDQPIGNDRFYAEIHAMTGQRRE